MKIRSAIIASTTSTVHKIPCPLIAHECTPTRPKQPGVNPPPRWDSSPRRKPLRPGPGRDARWGSRTDRPAEHRASSIQEEPQGGTVEAMSPTSPPADALAHPHGSITGAARIASRSLSAFGPRSISSATASRVPAASRHSVGVPAHLPWSRSRSTTPPWSEGHSPVALSRSATSVPVTAPRRTVAPPPSACRTNTMSMRWSKPSAVASSTVSDRPEVQPSSAGAQLSHWSMNPPAR